MKISNDLYITCSTIKGIEKKTVHNTLIKLSKNSYNIKKIQKISGSNLYCIRASINYRIILKKDQDQNFMVVDIIDKRREQSIKNKF